MSRSERTDDRTERADRDTPRRGTGLPVWAWVLIGLAVALPVVCGGGAVAVVAFATVVGGTTSGGGAVAKKTYTREEFRKAVVGRTKAEVLSLLGKPYRTVEPESGDYWMYENVTLDPVSGNLDKLTWVRFGGETVASVDF